MLLAFRAADDSLDEPVDRVELLDGQPRALRDAQLAGLVVERTLERLELAAHHLRPRRRDHRLRLRGDLRAVRRELHESVLQRAVIEAGLPRSVHRGLDPTEV